MSLALAQSEHQRSTKHLRDQLALAVDPHLHDDVTKRLNDAEDRATDLQRALAERTEETNKLIAGLELVFLDRSDLLFGL